jgi:uncharacterized protein YndB with AHSA1/START domain
MTGVTLVRRIRARPAVVFDAVTTAEGIARWWGPDAGPVLLVEADVRVGGRYRLRFRMLDGTEHESTGEYLELLRPERVVMSWRWTGGVEDPGESRLEMLLRPVPEGTELTFSHLLLHDEERRRSHEWGWTGALHKLEALFSAEVPAAKP